MAYDSHPCRRLNVTTVPANMSTVKDQGQYRVGQILAEFCWPLSQHASQFAD